MCVAPHHHESILMAADMVWIDQKIDNTGHHFRISPETRIFQGVCLVRRVQYRICCFVQKVVDSVSDGEATD